jgi:hypothetical protein
VKEINVSCNYFTFIYKKTCSDKHTNDSWFLISSVPIPSKWTPSISWTRDFPAYNKWLNIYDCKPAGSESATSTEQNTYALCLNSIPSVTSFYFDIKNLLKLKWTFPRKQQCKWVIQIKQIRSQRRKCDMQ